MRFLRRQQLSLTCPHCSQEIQTTIAWLKSHKHATCPDCRVLFLIDLKNLAERLKKPGKTLNAFLTAIRKIKIDPSSPAD